MNEMEPKNSITLSNSNFEDEQEKKNAKKIALLNQKLEDERRIQEAELLVDFDAALEEEANRKPLAIKFDGILFEVPYKMPFNFSMFFFRHCIKKINGKQVVEVEENKLLQFIELMLGKQFSNYLERSKNRVLSMELIFDKVANPIMRKWGYDIGTQGSELKQKKI